MELLAISDSPARQDIRPEEQLGSSDAQGPDLQQQVLHGVGNPSPAVAEHLGQGSIVPEVQKPPVVVPADLQQQAALEDNAGTEDATLGATSAAAQRGPEQDSFQRQLPDQSQTGKRA